MSTNNIRDNAGIAFALTVGAGLATLVGALVVFVPSLVNYYASRKFLAGGLGFSAGVMIYVSIEIFGKAMAAFENADFLRQQAYIATTLCFFGGIITMIVSISYMLFPWLTVRLLALLAFDRPLGTDKFLLMIFLHFA